MPPILPASPRSEATRVLAPFSLQSARNGLTALGQVRVADCVSATPTQRARRWRMGHGKSKGAPRGAPFPRTRHPLWLWTEDGSERRAVVRVPVPVPGTRTSGRSRAYDFPVTRERRRTRDQDLAALTGYRVDDCKWRRRRNECENSTERHHQRGELLPHLNLLLPHVNERLGPLRGQGSGNWRRRALKNW